MVPSRRRIAVQYLAAIGGAATYRSHDRSVEANPKLKAGNVVNSALSIRPAIFGSHCRTLAIRQGNLFQFKK
jgi:hypothetical protein